MSALEAEYSDSTNIRQFNRPTRLRKNSEVALEFIEKYGLTKNNIRSCLEFQNLDKTLKKAIYYQLDKLDKKFINEKFESNSVLESEQTVPESEQLDFPIKVWNAVLDKMPAVLKWTVALSIVLFLLSESVRFHSTQKLIPINPILFALIIELSILVTGTSKRWIFRVICFLLYAYNCFAVSYLSYVTDKTKQDIRVENIERKELLVSQKDAIEAQVKTYRTILVDNEARLKRYISKGLISKGNREVAPLIYDAKLKLAESEKSLKLAYEDLKTMDSLGGVSGRIGVGPETIILIFLKIVLQFLTILLFRELTIRKRSLA